MANITKILIVDDEKNIRLSVTQALESLGYVVKTAASGEEAITKVKEEVFKLILLDLKLPGIGGIEVLRQVIELHPDIQVIIISAYGTVESAVEAMKLGAIDFIQKPFTPKEIRSIVKQVLNRELLDAQKSSDYESWLELAKYSASQRQFDNAISIAQQAISLEPFRPEAFNLLGELQEIIGEQSEALKNYRVAIDLDPTYKPAHQNLDRATELHHKRPNLQSL
jgi:DNA-binding NtrC family response regulator